MSPPVSPRTIPRPGITPLVDTWVSSEHLEASGSQGAPDGTDHCVSTGAPPPSSGPSHQPSLPDLRDPPDLFKDSIVELNTVPREYLESNPYPAFALLCAVASVDSVRGRPTITTASASDTQFTPTRYAHVKPLSPLWSNSAWSRLAAEKELLLCLSVESAQKLGEWLLRMHPGSQKPQTQVSGHSEVSLDQALGIDPTLTLEFNFPGGSVDLELTKSFVPVYQLNGSASVRVSGHMFAVVTSVPRSGLRPPEPEVLEVEMADLALEENHKFLQNDDDTVQLEGLGPVALSNPIAVMINPDQLVLGGDWTNGDPVYFLRDGTYTHRPVPCDAEGGIPCDVNKLLDTKDWSKTPLGPRENWSAFLHSMVTITMNYPLNCSLWWGKKLTNIYNRHYADHVQDHPQQFGRYGAEAWADIWPLLGPMSELVLSGSPIYMEDQYTLTKTRENESTEGYRTQVWVPLKQQDGSIAGIFHAMITTTERVLSERRTDLLRDMGERTSISRTLDDYSKSILDTIDANPKDLPFGLLYRVEQTSGQRMHSGPRRRSSTAPTWADHPAMVSAMQLRYVGGVGVPEGHSSAPATVTLSSPSPAAHGNMMATAFTDPALSSPQSIGSQPPSFVFSSPSHTRSSFSTTHSASLSPSLPLTSPDVCGPESLPGVIQAEKESWPFLEAIRSRRPVLVEDCRSIIEGYEVRVWDVLPRQAVVIPIIRDSDEGVPSAILVAGLNYMAPFSADYQAFINAMRIQMASHLVAVRATQQDRDHIENLAALDRAKSLLFSNVSHELFTPLTLIAGPLDDLFEETPEGPKREVIALARRNTRRLTRLVTMLMDVSNLEAGRLRTNFTQVNFGVLTRDVAALFRKTLEKAKLQYIVKCDTTPQDVWVDPEKWEKILFNLIGNALKFTRKGYVYVSVEYAGNEAVFTVKDSGVGIAAADLKVIRSPTQDYTHHDGTGIALAFTKKLIEIHGGTLQVQSKTADESPDGSHGSTFRVKLPLGNEHLHMERGDSTEHGTNQQFGQVVMDEVNQLHSDWERDSVDGVSEPSVRSNDGSDKRIHGIDPSTLYFAKTDVIMLVDDQSDTRQYMRSIFEPFCKVVEARDGQEALAMYAANPPDLIIADVMMPHLNGAGLLNALRAGNRDQRLVPFILITSVDDARPDGAIAADDYLPKPFNARELIGRAHMQLQLGKKRRALEALFDHRTAELRALTDHSPVAIFRCNADGYVTYANSTWYELSGYPAHLDVTNWGDFVVEEHQAAVRSVWEEFVISGSPSAQAEWQWKNGRWVSTKAIRMDPVTPNASKGFVGCCVDITERKLNEELQRERVVDAEKRRAEAEEAKNQQELLIDITSHEIRNPISSLMQCASLVKTNLLGLQEQMLKSIREGSPFKPTQQLMCMMNEDLEALDSIYQCGLTQERISNDVLSLGKIQLDMLQMFDTETCVRDEARKIVSVFQNEARMKRIDLTYQLSPTFDQWGLTTVLTDPVRVGQVITNLLSNAIRFTTNSPERRIHLGVDVGLEPPAEGTAFKPAATPEQKPPMLTPETNIYVFVSVSDTGPGLTESELQTLFQRFTQASAKIHTVYGGSGLGLFVCRKITERLGGRIEAASQYGHGSTFRFFFKAKPCITPLPKEAVTTDRSSFFAGRPPHVLIVEDNHINQTVLQRQLKHVGLTTDIASDGVEALARARRVMAMDSKERRYDCVLMDLEMPIMNGYTAARQIRELEHSQQLKPTSIIALTGNARQAQIDAAMADFDDAIIKPYRLDDLLRKIERVVKASSEPASLSSRNLYSIDTPARELSPQWNNPRAHDDSPHWNPSGDSKARRSPQHFPSASAILAAATRPPLARKPQLAAESVAEVESPDGSANSESTTTPTGFRADDSPASPVDAGASEILAVLGSADTDGLPGMPEQPGDPRERKTIHSTINAGLLEGVRATAAQPESVIDGGLLARAA